MITLILAIIGGLLSGIITGLLPGLHPNIIASIMPVDSGIEAGILLFSCLITSNIFEFLSAAYLGTPEEGGSLAKQPLQQLIMNKRGITGMKIVAYTSIITYAVFLLISIVLRSAVISIYQAVKKYAWILLAGISLHLLIKEKNTRLALMFFIIAGALGIITFNMNLTEPFLPLLTGLFGLSSIINFQKDENYFPQQMKNSVIESSFPEITIASVTGIIGSIIMALVPSVSPSQVGLISKEYSKNSNELKIASMTSINISDNLLSLIALMTINKGRSGVVEKIGEIITLTETNYYLLLFTGFLTCVISAYLLIKIAQLFAEKIQIFNNNKTRILIILFVSLITFYFDRFAGIIILILSTLLGYYANKTSIRRSQLLGCLVIPTIIFYVSII